MGDQTEEPKSSGPHNSHANAELSTGPSPEHGKIVSLGLLTCILVIFHFFVYEVTK